MTVDDSVPFDDDAARDDADAPSTEVPDGRAARRVVATLLFLGLAALVAGAVFLGLRAKDARDRDDARAAALTAARQQAVNMTTIDYRTAERDLNRIIERASGELRKQFARQREQFPDILAKDQSQSVGVVLAAGLASLDGNRASAVVAVDATVNNTAIEKEQGESGQGVVKHYRMHMKLVRTGDRWLVDQVAFAGLPQ